MHLFKALLAQVIGWIITILALPLATPPITNLWLIAILQGAFAAGGSILLKAAPWWMCLHAVFSLLLVCALHLNLPPILWLLGFGVLLLLFWNSFSSRVPLFLTNRSTLRTLIRVLPKERPLNLVDLGCGTGTVLRQLARRFPDGQFYGIENAPLTCMIGKWLCRALPNCHITRGDMWEHDLSAHNVVYCFLSPVPMPDIGKKAARELAPDALLISNSFAIPYTEPLREIEATRRSRALYLYQRNNLLAVRDKSAELRAKRPAISRMSTHSKHAS